VKRAYRALLAVAILSALLVPGFVRAQAASSAVISTYAGSADFLNVPALSVGIGTPNSIVVGPDGTVYFSTGSAVYRLNPTTGQVRCGFRQARR
jgi:streptogramin lyase